jgi:cytochrome P450
MRLEEPSGRVRLDQCYTAGPVGTYHDLPHITSWNDVVEALTNPVFSHDASLWRQGAYTLGLDGYWATDGKEHQLLKAVTHALLRGKESLVTRMRAARRLTIARVRTIAGGEHDTFDYANDLAYPVTLGLIWEMVGLPDDKRDWLLGEVRAYEGRSFAGDMQPEPPAVREYLNDVVTTHAERLKHSPREPANLLDIVAKAFSDGKISLARAVGFVWMFLSASHGTLGTLIGTQFGLMSQFKRVSAFLDMAARVDFDRLSDPAELRGLQVFSDEANRLISPFPHGPTWPQEEIELSGGTVGPPSAFICFSAANRDPSVFAKPDVYNPFRGNLPRHLGYGWQRHRCTGEIIATTTSTIVTATAFQSLVGLGWDLDEGWGRTEALVDSNEYAPARFNRQATRRLLRL